MITKKTVQQELEQSKALESITQVYSEIASVRMKRVRTSVLTNRDFLNSIYKIFQQVIVSYKQELNKLVGGDRITFLAHNGRTVVVLLSVNSNLYGEAISQVFKAFLKEVSSSDVEATIVGRYGLSLYKQALPDRPYTYFELPEEGIDAFAMSRLLKHLVQYEEVRLVYPFFSSIASQKPEVLVINSSFLLSQDANVTKENYLFEPNILEVMKFFESEIFASLFEQSVRESQLATFASRMLAMDTASEKVNNHIKKLRLISLKISHSMSNKKQLQSLPAILDITGGSNGY